MAAPACAARRAWTPTARRGCAALRWRDIGARRSDKPKSWIIDNELAVSLARRPPKDFGEFNAVLDRHPKSPRRSRAELWAVLEALLGEADRQIPLLRPDAFDKQTLKAMQEAVVTVAQVPTDCPKAQQVPVAISRPCWRAAAGQTPWPMAPGAAGTRPGAVFAERLATGAGHPYNSRTFCGG